MTSLILLDNEAVQALRSVEHPKHRKVVSYVQVVTQRKRRAVPVDIQVPTTVRVEVGWDRTAGSWTFANHLRITDVALDTAQANMAASTRQRTQASAADAHLGAVIRSSGAGHITVITSDPRDAPVAASDQPITVVTI